MKTETPKPKTIKYRLTYCTKTGGIITIHYWHEFGNCYCEAFRDYKTMGVNSYPDENKILKPVNVTYGDSVITKRAYINVILMAENGMRWEVNFKDHIFDPISHEIHKGIIPGL